MSPTLPRDTIAGQAYNDLRNLAKRSGRDPAEYFTLYALEGFLARLTKSDYGEDLVLKGGVLMTAYTRRRPTRDIDLVAFGFPNDIKSCEDRIRSIITTDLKDGLLFDSNSIQGEVIREGSAYSGTRVHASASLGTARLHFHVDINFGDPINPLPTSTALPLLLGGEIEILAYPLAMLLAEKIVTAIDRGSANTRWRDFSVLPCVDNNCSPSARPTPPPKQWNDSIKKDPTCAIQRCRVFNNKHTIKFTYEMQ